MKTSDGTKDWPYLNEAHRKSSEACLKRGAYWAERTLTYEEAMHMFRQQGEGC